MVLDEENMDYRQAQDKEKPTLKFSMGCCLSAKTSNIKKKSLTSRKNDIMGINLLQDRVSICYKTRYDLLMVNTS